MNRIITVHILLAMVLLLSIAGCGAPTEPAQPTRFSVLYNQKEAQPFQEDWLILQEYKKRKNVIMDVLPGDDADYDTVIRHTFETGKCPTLF
jgi:hypothetical protein